MLKVWVWVPDPRSVSSYNGRIQVFWLMEIREREEATLKRFWKALQITPWCVTVSPPLSIGTEAALAPSSRASLQSSIWRIIQTPFQMEGSDSTPWLAMLNSCSCPYVAGIATFSWWSGASQALTLIETYLVSQSSQPTVDDLIESYS